MTASFKKIRSSLHSRYDAEARNERRGPSPRLSAWATQLQKKTSKRWCGRHCADLTRPVVEPQTFRTDSVPLVTEHTGRLAACLRAHNHFGKQMQNLYILHIIWIF